MILIKVHTHKKEWGAEKFVSLICGHCRGLIDQVGISLKYREEIFHFDSQGSTPCNCNRWCEYEYNKGIDTARSYLGLPPLNNKSNGLLKTNRQIEILGRPR
jgi:hypothetical protein